jgi:hypothetical protein
MLVAHCVSGINPNDQFDRASAANRDGSNGNTAFAEQNCKKLRRVSCMVFYVRGFRKCGRNDLKKFLAFLCGKIFTAKGVQRQSVVVYS